MNDNEPSLFEQIEKVRQSVFAYAKADLAILAFSITLLGVLKIERSEVFEYIYSVRWPLFVLQILIVLSLLLERIILVSAPTLNTLKNARIFSIVQMLLHALLLGALIPYAVGHSEGEVEYQHAKQTIRLVEDRVDEYMTAKHRLPADLKELISGSKSVEEFYVSIGAEEIGYARDDSVTYTIRVPWPGEKLAGAYGLTRHVFVRVKHDTVFAPSKK
jgi:hypothetical protein